MSQPKTGPAPEAPSSFADLVCRNGAPPRGAIMKPAKITRRFTPLTTLEYAELAVALRRHGADAEWLAAAGRVRRWDLESIVLLRVGRDGGIHLAGDVLDAQRRICADGPQWLVYYNRDRMRKPAPRIANPIACVADLPNALATLARRAQAQGDVPPPRERIPNRRAPE